MNAAKYIERAEHYRERMNSALAPIDKKLEELFDDPNACITYQHSDGWCVLFGDIHNAQVSSINFEALFKMTRDEAFDYLMERDI